MQIHAVPVFAPARIQENIPGELFMYRFRARGYVLVLVRGPRMGGWIRRG